MQGQGCPRLHAPPAPLIYALDSFLLISKHWKLVFQLLNIGSTLERQELTKVFLKGKFTEQLNHHLQSQGEAFTEQTPPSPPGPVWVSRTYLEWTTWPCSQGGLGKQLSQSRGLQPTWLIWH